MRPLILVLPVLMLASCGAKAPSTDQNSVKPPAEAASQNFTAAVESPSADMGPADAPGNASAGAPPPDKGAGVATPAADDVAAFRAKRDACDHFRGEEPTDAARGTFLAKALAENCAGTDKALAALRAKYKNDAKFTAALADYEDNIE
jgi:hypothetical protein